MIFRKDSNRMSSSAALLATRGRSKSLAAAAPAHANSAAVGMPDLRDIAVDSSIVMIAFLNNSKAARQSDNERYQPSIIYM